MSSISNSSDAPLWNEVPMRILTVPNFLTTMRILLLPVLLWALGERDKMGYVPAIAIGSGMIISDILDGFLARKLNQYSRLGWLLDPISDKLIIGCLAIFFSIEGLLPYWVTIIIIVRDLAILSFGFVLTRSKILPKPIIWGRLCPMLWGISFSFILIGWMSIAWIVIVITLILTFFSAGIYYSEFRKVMEKSA